MNIKQNKIDIPAYKMSLEHTKNSHNTLLVSAAAEKFSRGGLGITGERKGTSIARNKRKPNGQH